MTLREEHSYFYELSLRNWFPYRELLEDLNDALEVKEGDLILDAGCGQGFVIERVLKTSLIRI